MGNVLGRLGVSVLEKGMGREGDIPKFELVTLA
jgi:hypothetical protein